MGVRWNGEENGGRKGRDEWREGGNEGGREHPEGKPTPQAAPHTEFSGLNAVSKAGVKRKIGGKKGEKESKRTEGVDTHWQK